LPPIRAFEAAARHLSVKAAAEELLLTPSAVSHAIQTLEGWLDVDLFDRSGRTLRLTDAGANLLPRLTSALTNLAAATSEIPGHGAGKVLRLSVAVTIANRLLLPRLPAFTMRHPDLTISLDTSHRTFEAPVDGVDAALRIAESGEGLFNWTMLVRERLVPVCAPDLLANIGTSRGLASLPELPMVGISSVPREWEVWSEAAQVSLSGRSPDLTVDTIQLGFHCAEAGLGIMLGRRPLIDDALAAGILVTAGREVEANTAIWLIMPDGVVERPETRAFRHWIQKEFLSRRANSSLDSNGLKEAT
jgi:DNA-binding transcriptional LysR family regulator